MKQEENVSKEEAEVMEEVNLNQTEEALENEAANEEQELTQEQKRIAELESQLEEMSQRILRIQADYDNFRRRTREEQASNLKYKSQPLMEQLLPALDNFERALQLETDNEQTQNLLQGMNMVYRQIQDAFKQEGLEEIVAVGQVFDPHLHQAVMQVEDESIEKNTIVEELQKGYKLKDRVLRPAMVKVNA